MRIKVFFKEIELDKYRNLSYLITELQIALDCAEQGNSDNPPLVDIEYFENCGYIEIYGYREETQEEKESREAREKDSKRVKLLQYNSLKKELGL